MISYPVFSEKSLTLCHYLVIITAISAPVSTAISSIASIGLLVCWLLSGQLLPTLKLACQNPVGKAILVFTGWLFIGCLYAETDLSDKMTTLLSWKKLLFLFILLGLYYEPQWQQRFVRYYLIFMALAALAALPLWTLGLVVRKGCEPGIFFTNYSTQSMAFIAALLCCIFLLKEALTTRHKVYLWSAIALFLFNILIVSPARSGYVALLPAMIFAGIILYGFKRLPQVIGILACLFLVAAFSSSTMQERIKLGLAEQGNYQNSSELTSIGVRMLFYRNTLELIKEKPVFGYGTSAFAKTYSNYVASKYQDWRNVKTSDPHNQYLFVWLENGLIGLLLFFAYIFVALRQGWTNQPYSPIAACLLVAICASSLFNSHFKTFAEGNLLAFFLGALLARQDFIPRKVKQHA